MRARWQWWNCHGKAPTLISSSQCTQWCIDCRADQLETCICRWLVVSERHKSPFYQNIVRETILFLSCEDNLRSIRIRSVYMSVTTVTHISHWCLTLLSCCWFKHIFCYGATLCGVQSEVWMWIYHLNLEIIQIKRLCICSQMVFLQWQSEVKVLWCVRFWLCFCWA